MALNFCILILFVNCLQALYANPGCLKCILVMKFCPGNKNLLIMLLSFIHLER